MATRRKPTIKTLLLLVVIIAAYTAIFVANAHGAPFPLSFIAWRAGVLALWLCFGMSVAMTSRKHWRVFAECFGLRFATCLFANLVYVGPPGLQYWYPPGTNPLLVPDRVPLWAGVPAGELGFFDRTLINMLNDFIGWGTDGKPPLDFMWPHATETFFVTSAVYGLLMYLLARTCLERAMPADADAP